jgi:hypothetical protein
MSSVVINAVTTALMQRGNFSRPGFYGNQEQSASNDSFNTAVNIGAALAGVANVLQSVQAPPDYQRTPDNYLLTDIEKQAIYSKSTELASYGVIPQDSLSDFLYILAANENPNDLYYIADVIGIPELGDTRYIRNIRGICEIKDIYKIGYLANGVSSVTRRYAPKYRNIQQYGDYTRSSSGSLLSAANLGTSLGVVGPAILATAFALNNNSNNSYGLSNAPSLSSDAINGAINGYSALASGSTGSLSPQTIGAILNPAATMQNEATMIGAGAIQSLLGQSPLGGALGSLGALGGIAIGALLSQSGGNSIGSFMSEVLTGQRIATSKIANNPMLTSPSFHGKSFFGEAPVSLPAIDQVYCKRIGSFGTMSGGGGAPSFAMQNFASMGGSQPISSVVSSLVTGSSVLPPSTTFYGQQVATMVTNLCSNMNVPTTSSIEMRRSDNSIPLMLGLSATMVGENFSPFGSKPFTSGWQLASSAANDVQKYNPQYLQACRTSL